MTKLQEYLNNITDKNKVEVISANPNWFKFSSNGELVYGYEGGDLDLSQFPNLKRLELPVRCLSTPLTSLNLKNCANLEDIIIQENSLNSLDFLNDLPNLTKLKELSIHSNNFPKPDLTTFNKFTNLEYLNIDGEAVVFNSPNFFGVGLIDKETQTDLTGRDIEKLLKLEAQIQQPPK